MSSVNMQRRRKLRSLEAARDKLIEDISKKKTDLVKVRAELKSEKAK
jgi:hypothetical protein